MKKEMNLTIGCKTKTKMEELRLENKQTHQTDIHNMIHMQISLHHGEENIQ
jgi:hypothetical protein